MILILCEAFDNTINEVVEWLKYNKMSFVRIDKEDNVEVNCFSSEDEELQLIINKEKTLFFKDINAIWYRKGNFNFYKPAKNPFELITGYDYFINLELHILRQSLFDKINKKTVLGDYFYSIGVNKIKNLEIARECGLSIPKYLITSNKNIAAKFIANQSTITKPLSECVKMYDDECFYNIYTSEVKIDDLKRTDFFPSLLQVKINKKYELRIFVFAKTFYSMAIFSQKDKQTKVDYRNYNYENMNRMVPYKLPVTVQRKILKFMKLSGINTGSFDFIVDEHDNYFFLEVNPVGNIEMISKNCYYSIEKDIANFLISNSHGN